MESLYATMITLLFSAWVWELKGQIATPQGETEARDPQRAALTEDVPAMAAVATRRQPPAQRRPGGSTTDTRETQGVPRNNGVPTWVIN